MKFLNVENCLRRKLGFSMIVMENIQNKLRKPITCRTSKKSLANQRRRAENLAGTGPVAMAGCGSGGSHPGGQGGWGTEEDRCLGAVALALACLSSEEGPEAREDGTRCAVRPERSWQGGVSFDKDDKVC